MKAKRAAVSAETANAQASPNLTKSTSTLEILKLSKSMAKEMTAKEVGAYEVREMSLLRELDAMQINLKVAEGSRQLLHEHSVMLSDARAKNDHLYKSLLMTEGKLKHTSAELKKEQQTHAAIKKKYLDALLKSETLQSAYERCAKDNEELRHTQSRMHTELKRKDELLETYEGMLSDSTHTCNNLSNELKEAKENSSRASFLGNIIDRMGQNVLLAKAKIEKILLTQNFQSGQVVEDLRKDNAIKTAVDKLANSIQSLQLVSKSFKQKVFS
jgi:hypothetical protein